ncbi:MAG: HNH endonuclease [Candidatus Daviesbacteria bacterium]|nr:HNH endonuclease [Candidatus Daviesbacteria bacterium]
MRRGISLKVRYAVLKRDEFKCVLCGSGANKTQLRIDHKIPIVRDGTNNIENLQTLCSPCNHGKMIYENEK